MRVTFDDGRGGTTGRWLSLHFGPGCGYLRKWWCRLNAGPGQATTPETPCGHRGLAHCNSAYCTRAWCGAQSWPVFGWLFTRGHTMRIWAGPAHNRSLRNLWREARLLLRRSRGWR